MSGTMGDTSDSALPASAFVQPGMPPPGTVQGIAPSLDMAALIATMQQQMHAMHLQQQAHE